MLAEGAKWKIALTGLPIGCLSWLHLVRLYSIAAGASCRREILTLGTTLQVRSGLAWGAALGELLRRSGTWTVISMRLIQSGGLAMILLIGQHYSRQSLTHSRICAFRQRVGCSHQENRAAERRADEHRSRALEERR